MTADRKFPFKKYELTNLRAVLKGCEGEACGIRHKEIHKTEKLEKWTAWQKKRRLGQFARHHLLAYGFLTGRAYLELERSRHAERLLVNGCLLYDSAIDVEYLTAVCKQHTPNFYIRKDLTREVLSAWILENRPFFLTHEEVLAKKKEENEKRKAAPV